MLSNIHTIITHPGQAHRDEFLAICLALVNCLGSVRVERRVPTEEELESNLVLCLDIGGRHEPARLNFDHHQLERSAPATSSLKMLAQALGLDEAFSYQKWYHPTHVFDSKGPFALSRQLELPKFPFELMSPIEDILLKQFEEMSVLSYDTELHMLSLMHSIGIRLENDAIEFEQRIQALSDLTDIVDIGGVPTIVLEDSDETGLQDFCDGHEKTIGMTIMHDDRGPGWKLYRFNDDDRVDFSLLGDDPCIEFAHAGGFIAKTKERLPRSDAFALAAKAVKSALVTCPSCGMSVRPAEIDWAGCTANPNCNY